jgi:hypothetical protein
MRKTITPLADWKYLCRLFEKGAHAMTEPSKAEKWFGPDTKKQKRREDWLALILFVGMIFYVVSFCMGWTSCPK